MQPELLLALALPAQNLNGCVPVIIAETIDSIWQHTKENFNDHFKADVSKAQKRADARSYSA